MRHSVGDDADDIATKITLTKRGRGRDHTRDHRQRRVLAQQATCRHRMPLPADLRLRERAESFRSRPRR